MTSHKQFIVFVYYGYEGWQIHGEADTAEEALKVYAECHTWGIEVIIVSPCTLRVIPSEGKPS